MSYDKPLPCINSDNKPFWEGCHLHELRFQQCLDCGHVRWPPAIIWSSSPRANHLMPASLNHRARSARCSPVKRRCSGQLGRRPRTGRATARPEEPAAGGAPARVDR